MIKTKGLILLWAFGLNLVWENLQAPLYAGYKTFWQHLPACIFGAVGDAILIFCLYLFTKIILPKATGFLFYALLAILGLLSAVVIEKFALQMNLWQYGDMPMLPIVNIGLYPVLQMTFLAPLSIFFAKLYDNR